MAETPTQGLDFESETPDHTPAAGGLLDDAPAKATGAAALESVDFDDDDIYRRPGELSVCSEKTIGLKHRFSVMRDPADPTRAFLRRTFTHYVMGKGHAKCFSKRDGKGNIVGEPAFCCLSCTQESEARARLGALVVEYTCCDPKSAKFPAGLGSPEVPFTFEIKALCMSAIQAQQLNNKSGETDDGAALKVPDVDYYYQARTDKKKGLEFERIGPKASYTKNPAIQAQVMEAFAKYADGKELARKMTRELNANQMRDHLGLGGATPAGDSAFEGL